MPKRKQKSRSRKQASDEQHMKQKTPKAKEPTPKAKAKAKDKFGSRMNSNRGRFNAALTTKPQTMKALITRAQMSYAPTDHILNLLKRRLIKRIDKDGKVMYSLK